MNARTIITITSVAALGLIATSANASITSTVGGVIQIGPPPACGLGQLTGSTAFAWDEQQAVASVNVLTDETANPGGSAAPVFGVLNGTYDSHFLHFEPVGGVVGTAGTITFSTAIQGVIYRALFLDATDVSHGAFGTAYPTGYPQRGFAGQNGSAFTIIGNTLHFNFTYLQPSVDIIQLRILTDAVPAPGAGGLVAAAGVVGLRRRRR